ncbi:MAG: YdiU family protein [Sulfurovum sp.]|nr:YdiU family protein [Sulfurovum sp.]
MKFSQLTLKTDYLKLSPIFYAKVEVSALEKPFVISTSQNAGELLGVDEDLSLDEKLLDIVNGKSKLKGADSFAMCYAGHQFGDFTERLGDGRVINFGKVAGQNIQVKGAGLTLYSRLGDGRAVLRSSLREYLMSEAMYGLGIESSRALALIGSHTSVARDAIWEKCAMVIRLAPTWVRFGTFEYLYSIREYDKLEELADYVIGESYPHLQDSEDKYLKMYREIVKNTATTIAKWQSVGFTHGVMNTDNMAIDGSTIDYGPFAFLDEYQPHFVCNHTDTQGLYSFKNQAGAGRWNLDILARVLSPIIDYELSEEVLRDTFWRTYTDVYEALLYQKMGLYEQEKTDKALLEALMRALASSRSDYTDFFRRLSTFDGNSVEILACSSNNEALALWLKTYLLRVDKESISSKERHEKMLKTNPKYILKNHLLQEAIEKAEVQDYSMIEDLLEVALAPFDEHSTLAHLCKATPTEVKNIALCCSS